MELIFPFKNISTNNLIDLIEDRENIDDFILTEKDEYPYSENFFLARIDHFKDSLPDFENEILQIINTTNQETIDAYFSELKDNTSYILDIITVEEIRAHVKEWNNESLKAFEEKVKQEEEDFFNHEDRKKAHLEEYETWEFGGFLNLFGDTQNAKRSRK